MSKADRAARPLPIRVARRVLPAAVRGWLRSMVAPTPSRSARSKPETTAPAPSTAESVPHMDLERFLEFSVADLFYADTDLDRAMDLLAICGVGRPAATG